MYKYSNVNLKIKANRGIYFLIMLCCMVFWRVSLFIKQEVFM